MQELELVLAESEILHRTEPAVDVARVNKQIHAVRQKIDDEHLRRYDMLRRNGLGVVWAATGVCSGCHLNVPQGDLNRMRRGQMPWACPNCARFIMLD